MSNILKNKGKMFGLAKFISDIRHCPSKEAENERINKELANIRSKFKGFNALNGYSKKKYLCKLVFIFLIGPEPSVGHMEAITVLSSTKFSEKQAGYMFISVVMNNTYPYIHLILKPLKNDLRSNNPIFQNMALQLLANMGTLIMARITVEDVLHLIMQDSTLDYVKQSAILALLHLCQINPDLLKEPDFAKHVAKYINHENLGLALAAVSLIRYLSEKSPDSYKSCLPTVTSKLYKINTAAFSSLDEYSYYHNFAPWLNVNLLSLMKNFSISYLNPFKVQLFETLEIVLLRSQINPSNLKASQSNAKNAVLFEAISLIGKLELNETLLHRACVALNTLLRHNDQNIVFECLDVMNFLLKCESAKEKLKRYLPSFLEWLNTESDTWIQRRIADILYGLCDESNVDEVMETILFCSKTGEYCVREEMVLKVTMIAERFSSNTIWFVNVLLELIQNAPEYVNEETLCKFIQVVSNHAEVQEHAAKAVCDALSVSGSQENLVKVSGYILGEFGSLIADDPAYFPEKQFNYLLSKYYMSSLPAKYFLLTTFMKFLYLYPDLKLQIQFVFRENSRSTDTELQQRSVEYLKLSYIANQDLMTAIFGYLKQAEKSDRNECHNFMTVPVDNWKRSSYSLRSDFTLPSTGSNVQIGEGTLTNSISTVDIAGYFDYFLTSNKSHDRSNNGISVSVTSDMSEPSNETFSDGILIELNSATQNFHKTYDFYGKDVSNTQFLKNLIYSNSGILYDSDMMQVLVAWKFDKHIGSFKLVYCNKTNHTFQHFFSSKDCRELRNKCIVLLKPCQSVIYPGEQIRQEVDIECLNNFDGMPFLHLRFSCKAVQHDIRLKLPLTLNKFMDPVCMKPKIFFQKWKEFSNYEIQQVFPAKCAFSLEHVKTKFRGFQFGLLENTVYSKDRIIVSGVCHSKSHQIGLLGVLEHKRNMYRLTLRCPNYYVRNEIFQLVKIML